MVNEIGDKIENKNENEQWTIRLGKYVTYNPSPFMDQADLMRKSLAIAFIVILGIVIIIYAPAVQILGILIIGSALFFYGLSFYETNLFDKRTRHELR
jgi:hypothetical protein